MPATIIKEFAAELSGPFADILNCSIKRGEYADIWKTEMVTPVPKAYPSKDESELRKISGLKNFSKITEKIIGDLMMDDISASRDESQYGNEKGVSVNHYLIKMIHEILLAVDNNFAVFCAYFVKWHGRESTVRNLNGGGPQGIPIKQ